MSNYKLVKQLQKAGFPQKGVKDWFDEKGKSGCNPFEELCDCAIPTLSELIDECGDEFAELSQKPNPKSKMLVDGEEVNWRATARNGVYELGKTKDIAVAKLWLKINNKGRLN